MSVRPSILPVPSPRWPIRSSRRSQLRTVRIESSGGIFPLGATWFIYLLWLSRHIRHFSKNWKKEGRKNIAALIQSFASFCSALTLFTQPSIIFRVQYNMMFKNLQCQNATLIFHWRINVFHISVRPLGARR